MNHLKRQLKTCGSNKKLRVSRHMTCIEDLSSELILEIFDYLDGCHLYNAFSNLNKQFHDILSSSYLRLKINIIDNSKQAKILYNHQNIILPNRHQIVALSLFNILTTDLFFQFMQFNSSFQRLESIVLFGLKSDNLLSVLLSLISIPQLNSLILTVFGNNLNDFSNVYRVIFSLSKLKYNKLCFDGPTPLLYLTNINNQPSNIKHLNFNHSCRSTDLVHLFSYTPHLSHFVCKQLIQSFQLLDKTTVSLPYLTHISIGSCCLSFDELEIFLSKISCRLQVFRISISNNETYLDADRWERLVSQHIPYLRHFYFEYNQSINDNFETSPYHTMIHRFTSSFWLERQWILKLHLNVNSSFRTKLIYSIQPHRAEWDEINKEHWSSKSSYTGTELTIFESSGTNYNDLLIDNLVSFFNIIPIRKLDLVDGTTFIGILLDLLRYLPNLTSLRIRSLSLMKPRYLQVEEKQIFRMTSSGNEIKNVSIQQMTNLTQVQCLIDLCPMMKYFEIGFSDDIDVKLLVPFILIENRQHISHLRVLCLYSLTTNEKMVEELQNIIRSRKRYQKYQIKHIDNRIYIYIDGVILSI